MQVKFEAEVEACCCTTLGNIAINLWHQKFVTADVTAVTVNDEHGIQRLGQDFDKKNKYTQ